MVSTQWQSMSVKVDVESLCSALWNCYVVPIQSVTIVNGSLNAGSINVLCFRWQRRGRMKLYVDKWLGHHRNHTCFIHTDYTWSEYLSSSIHLNGNQSCPLYGRDCFFAKFSPYSQKISNFSRGQRWGDGRGKICFHSTPGSEWGFNGDWICLNPTDCLLIWQV